MWLKQRCSLPPDMAQLYSFVDHMMGVPDHIQRLAKEVDFAERSTGGDLLKRWWEARVKRRCHSSFRWRFIGGRLCRMVVLTSLQASQKQQHLPWLMGFRSQYACVGLSFYLFLRKELHVVCLQGSSEDLMAVAIPTALSRQGDLVQPGFRCFPWLAKRLWQQVKYMCKIPKGRLRSFVHVLWFL